jgi:hypothetical protein
VGTQGYPCLSGPNVVLKATVLRRGRLKTMLEAVTPWQESSKVTLARFGIL